MDDAGLREIFPYEEIWDLFFHTGEAMFFSILGRLCFFVVVLLKYCFGYTVTVTFPLYSCSCTN